jgi:hypothetical protein
MAGCLLRSGARPQGEHVAADGEDDQEGGDASRDCPLLRGKTAKLAAKPAAVRPERSAGRNWPRRVRGGGLACC